MDKNSQFRIYDWDQANLSLSFCYEGTIPLVGRGETHPDFNSAWLVKEGWAEIRCGEGKPLHGNVGDWLIVPPGQRFQQFSEDAEIVSIAFHVEYSPGEPLFGKNLPTAIKASDWPVLEKRAATLLKLTFHNQKAARFSSWTQRAEMLEYLRVKLAFLRWLEALTGALARREVLPQIRVSGDNVVRQVIRIFRAAAHREELNVADLAQRVGISMSQLHRRFTAATGESLLRYYSRMRLHVAKDRLRRDQSSLKAIAYEMGFRHPSNFSNWFKAGTGVSPRAYREKHG